MTAFCRVFVLSAGLRGHSFDTTPVSDLPYLKLGLSFLAQSLVSVDRRLQGGDHPRVMRGFLYASIVQALGTPVPDRLYCLRHPVLYQCVGGLLLTQE